MKIFFDVDNTILDHYGFYSYETESRFHYSIAKFPKENIKAIEAMYDSSFCRDPKKIKELLELDYVYILTKYPVYEYENAKIIKLASILDIKPSVLTSMSDKNGNLKYISLDNSKSKVDVVKKVFKTDTLENYFLVDDYSENILEWESMGGTGIKYYNEYNSMLHPSSGISISNFNIFNPLIDKKSFNLISLILTSKSYTDNFVKLISNRGFRHVNFKEVIYEDLINKMQINELSSSYKHKHYDFMLSYYMFMDDLKPGYWTDKIDVDDKVLLSTPFLLSNCAKFKQLNTLSIEVLGEYSDKKSISDVYIHVEQVKNIYDTNDKYLKIFKKIADLINVKGEDEQV